MSEQSGRRIVDSPLGDLILVASGEGLTHIRFPAQKGEAPSGEAGTASESILDLSEAQLMEYFAGRRLQFELPLSPMGTEFQLAVWWALAGIPYGNTLSYGELARRIGRPKAVRAVGAANGANPLPIVLSCHRVIGADGSLTGFGGGLPAKICLLELEGALLG